MMSSEDRVPEEEGDVAVLPSKEEAEEGEEEEEAPKQQPEETTPTTTTVFDDKPHPLFDFMAKHPWPFLFAIPIIFLFLVGFGWSIDDKIESEVANIWIAQDGDYAKDVDYAKSVGKNDLAATSFAAMAISRDGKNIMTEARLQEIRSRMQETENTTVRGTKNNIYKISFFPSTV